MFYFKLTNGEMVKWWIMKCCHGEIKIRIGHLFSRKYRICPFLIFEHNIFAADKAIHTLQFLIINNKYSNQDYVIKPSNQWKMVIYQGLDDHCEGDHDSDLYRLDSAISGNTLL